MHLYHQESTTATSAHARMPADLYRLKLKACTSILQFIAQQENFSEAASFLLGF